jgi:dihydrofolate reductase
MTILSLVAAVDQAFGLGRHNQLLCHLPADLKYFKELTWGKPIIMGRKTFESIGRALPGRRNVVLSHQPGHAPDVEYAESLTDALHLVADAQEAMVIGGAQVFTQVLSMGLAKHIYLTQIQHTFEADVFFPLIDDTWQCVSRIYRPADDKNPYDLYFCQYEKI